MLYWLAQRCSKEEASETGVFVVFLRGSREHKKNVLENHEKAIEKGAQPIGCLACPMLFEGRSIRNRGFCGVFWSGSLVIL